MWLFYLLFITFLIFLCFKSAEDAKITSARQLFVYQHVRARKFKKKTSVDWNMDGYEYVGLSILIKIGHTAFSIVFLVDPISLILSIFLFSIVVKTITG